MTVFDAAGTTALLSVADQRLGTVMIEHGVISDDQCRTALTTCRRTGSRLGSVLIASGFATPRQVYVALAAAWGADYAEVDAEDFDPEILALVDLDQTLREGWIPIQRDGNGTIVVLTAQRPTEELRTQIELTLRDVVRLVVSSDWELSRAIQLGYRDAVVDRATLALWRADPSASARTVLDQRQKITGLFIALTLITCALLWPRASLDVLSLVISFGFLVGIAFKFVMCMTGARKEFEAIVTPEEVAALRDDELPIYTVLVPSTRRPASSASWSPTSDRSTIRADKLEILLLLEDDDTETLEAIQGR